MKNLNQTIKPVLFVVTSHNVKGATGIPTGFNLSEVTHPLEKLQAADIAVEFASIQGGQPPLDGLEDFNDPTNAHYWADADFRAALAHTLRLDDVDASRYSAIFYAGGHGTMWDFPDSAAVHKVTRSIYEAGGIVSAVCHGPAALVNVRLGDGSYLVAGKRLAAFTDDEEAAVESTHVVPFLLASTLSARGATHQAAANWTSQVVVDGRLVTGQNPQSGARLGEALRDLLIQTRTLKEAATMPKPDLSPEDVAFVSPALAKYTQQAIVNGVWKRPTLSLHDRSIVTLAALIMRNQTRGLPHYFNKALDNGVTPAEVSELITHVAFYAGWPHAFSAIAIVKDIFAERGITADQLPGTDPTLLSIAEALPDEDIRLAFTQQNFTPLVPGLVQITDELLYHEVWLRPGLAPRDRNLVTVSALIAAGQTTFLPFYLNRALLKGVTKAQISEIVTHLAFYAGWATVLSNVATIQQVLDNRAD